MSAVLKKKNRFGLYFKRKLNLTNEPKLFYYKGGVKDTSRKQYIELDFETKLERLDKNKFKISAIPINHKREKIY